MVLKDVSSIRYYDTLIQSNIDTMIQRPNQLLFAAIKIDLKSKIPLRTQVQEAIEAQIATGSLLPGDQLPTVRELADHLNVNFNTVARAYRSLDNTGQITTRQGRGTYVVESPVTITSDRSEKNKDKIEEYVHTVLQEAARSGISDQQFFEVLDRIVERQKEKKASPKERKHIRRQKKPVYLPWLENPRRKSNKSSHRRFSRES